jgi:hypothetical protein
LANAAYDRVRIWSATSADLLDQKHIPYADNGMSEYWLTQFTALRTSQLRDKNNKSMKTKQAAVQLLRDVVNVCAILQTRHGTQTQKFSLVGQAMLTGRRQGL